MLSDMCHDTMGAPVADVASSLSLCETAASIAVGNMYAISDTALQTLPESVQAEFQQWRQGVLRPNGSLVMKILEGVFTGTVTRCQSGPIHRLQALQRKAVIDLCMLVTGSGTKEFADMLRPYFAKVAFVRPKATRKESREVYIVCTGHVAPKS